MNNQSISKHRTWLVSLFALGIACCVLSNMLILANVDYGWERQSLDSAGTLIAICCMLVVAIAYRRSFPWRILATVAACLIIVRFLDNKSVSNWLVGITGISETNIERSIRNSFYDLGIGLCMLAPLLLVLRVNLHSTEASIHAEREQARAEELEVVKADQDKQLLAHSQLLRNVGVSITATDLKGNVTYWSDASEALYGYSAQEVMGRPLRTLTLAEDTNVNERRRIETVRRKGIWSGEYLQQRKDKTTFWSETIISRVHDENGRTTGYIGIDKDVSDKKQAEQAQRESEERFQAIFDVAPIPMCITAFESGTILHANTQMVQSFDMQSTGSDQYTAPDYYYHPEDRGDILHQLQSEGAIENREVRLWSKEREPKWYSLSIRAIPLSETKAIITALYDITDRREAEETLNKSISTITSMFQAFPDLQFRVLHDGTIIDYVSGDDAILYLDPKNFMGRRMQDVLPPDVGKLFANAFQEVHHSNGPVAIEYGFKGKKRETHFEARVVRIDDEELLVIAREVTEQVKARKSLAESEARYRLLADNSTDVISRSLMNGTVHFVSPSLKKVFGYHADEVLGRKVFDFMHPDDRERVLSEWKALSPKLDDFEFLYRIRSKNGDYRWVEARGKFVRNPITNEKFESINISRDITDRIAAEEATRESEYRYRTLVENMPMPCFTFDKDGTFLSWNEAAKQSYGYTSNEAIGASCFDLIVTPMTREATTEVIKRVFSHEVVVDSEWQDKNKQGEIGWRMGNAFPITNENGEVAFGVNINIDVTEKKRAEEQLRVTEKLASIGTLASGVAHQINNPLASITLYANNATREIQNALTPHDRALRCIEGIQKETLRCARIVESILTFSRGVDSEIEQVNLVKLVTRARDSVLKETSTEPSAIQLIVPEQSIQAKLHPMLIEQMVVNLLKNALEATNNDKPVEIRLYDSDDSIHLSVVDYGQGIKDVDKSRIFDPFYTTRRKKGGTGLGLSIVHRIVEQHGGRIEIQSKLNHGTTISVKLPVEFVTNPTQSTSQHEQTHTFTE